MPPRRRVDRRPEDGSAGALYPPGKYIVKVYATDIAGNAQRKVGSAKLIVKWRLHVATLAGARSESPHM